MTKPAHSAHWRQHFVSLLTIGTLSACSYAYVGPDFPTEAKGMDPDTFECCFEPEKFYPAGLTDLALQLGNTLGPSASQLVYGDYEESEFPGLLTGKTQAHAEMLARLKPFDIVVISNHSYPVGRLMPGRFSHSLIYLGTEAELRAAGYWTHPALAPYRDDIRAGKTLMEAAWPAVQLITPTKAFEVDQALLMRPALSASDKRRSFERMFSVMGKPFNYTLGIDPTGESFACTGLVDYSMGEIGFTHRQVYGQSVVMPDDVAAQAVRGDNLTILGYMAGTEDGYAWRSRYALMVELASYWGVPGKQ